MLRSPQSLSRKHVKTDWWIHVRLENDQLKLLGGPFDSEEDAYAASRTLRAQYPNLSLSRSQWYTPVPIFQTAITRLPPELQGDKYANLREEIRRAMGNCAAMRHFPTAASLTEQRKSLKQLSQLARHLHRDLKGSAASSTLMASGSDGRGNYLASIHDLERLDKLIGRASDTISSVKAKRPDPWAWQYISEILAIFEKHAIQFDLKKGGLFARVLDATLPKIASKPNVASALKRLKRRGVLSADTRGIIVPKKTRG